MPGDPQTAGHRAAGSAVRRREGAERLHEVGIGRGHRLARRVVELSGDRIAVRLARELLGLVDVLANLAQRQRIEISRMTAMLAERDL